MNDSPECVDDRTARTVRREQYRPPPYLVDEIDLKIELDPQRTVVTACSRLRRNEACPGTASLVLDGEAIELLELELDGLPLAQGAWRRDAHSLTIDAPPERFVLRVVTSTAPASNTSLMGLYLSNGNFFTQCEAQGFRRITFFPDRPDVMSRYTVTLYAECERYPVLLSNGNLSETGVEAPAAGRAPRHWARWIDPFPKPSYLFALVAGTLVASEQEIDTRSGRTALLQAWVEPGEEDRTGHAMRALVDAIRWDEQRFGLELDLERFMIVAVSDFNMGAMENKGLNIFNTRYVFATPRLATDSDFFGIESVVAHEYFHNWTGNRVTCRDWFQLTLKEGLTVFRDQEFSADMLARQSSGQAEARSARAVKRIEDVRVLRAAQFPEDAGPMAHPIRPDAYQEINNFYTVTVYEKGAEVIRMLHTLVGEQGFQRGLALYFARHDGQAVTCDDFVAAIADANETDLGLFGRWYSQAGTPRLTVSAHHDPRACTYTLDIEQRTAPTAGQPDKAPVHIPIAVGLVGDDGKDIALRLRGAAHAAAQPRTTVVLELTESRQRFVFDEVARAPVPSLLRNFSAPVIVEYRYTASELAYLARHDSDPFNRWEAMQRLAVEAMLAVVSGATPQAAGEVLVDAAAALLDDARLDCAFRQLALALPPEGVLAEHLPVVDPLRVRSARDGLLAHLGVALRERWRDTWHALASDEPYAPTPSGAGRRSLRNAALSFWVRSGDGAAFDAAAAQFDGADNMTDRHAALQALVNSPASERVRALADYERMFADEPLAMDKWLAVQATMHRQPGDPAVLVHCLRNSYTHFATWLTG
ncbi:MAG: aminopeptidase N, partial [Burkholderiaceae bacterium]|nr:aminopeptidase N [Burkholderiaceae bacterium]